MHIQPFFHGCKNDNFQSKSYDYFYIFAQNIDCGYTLEPPQWGSSNEYLQSVGFCSEAVLTSTHNLCFRAKI